MNKLLRYFFSAFLIFSLLFLPSCLASNTEIQASWHDTSYNKGPMKGFLVLLVSKDILKRRTFEDTLNQFFTEKGIQSIVGYKVIPPDVEITEELVKSCLVGVDADAILVSNIIGVKKETEVIPGNYFSSYYTRSYRSPYVRSEVVEVENLYLDSRLYRCDTETLIWQLQLRVANTKPFNNVVKKFSAAIYKNLSKKNLL